MKKLALSICLLVVVITAQAQTNYQKGMTKGLEMMKAAKTSEEFINVANHFERIANAEKDQWLPIYWGAYTTMFAGMNAKKESEQDELYDKSLAMIDLLEARNADQSEMLTLKAYVSLMKISVSPMLRAPQGTPAAMEMLMKAEKINPANPRPFLVHGQNTFYTPEFFGGGKEAAKPMITNAVNLYAQEKASDDFMPRWGKGRAEYLLKECE